MLNLVMKLSHSFTKVTKLSKIIALALFVSLPFLGFYLGMRFQKNLLLLDLAQRENGIKEKRYKEDEKERDFYSDFSEAETYYSTNWPIQVDYISGNEVKEREHRICVGGNFDVNGKELCSSNFIEFYEKKPSETLEEAIKKSVLKDDNRDICKVYITNATQRFVSANMYNSNLIDMKYNTELKVYERIPKEGVWLDDIMTDYICGTYTYSTGPQWFRMDRNHPGFFWYMELGGAVAEWKWDFRERNIE